MKIKEISIEEFNDLDLDMQISYYNTYAKRTNRQIRTQKAKGTDLSLFPELERSNIKMIKKTESKRLQKLESKHPERAQKEMVEKFKALQDVTHGGITEKNIKDLEEDRKAVEDTLGRKLSGEEYWKWIKSEKYSKTAGAMYYEVLKYGVEHGYGGWGYPKAQQPDLAPSEYDETLRKINDYIARTYGADAVTMGEMSDLETSAREFFIDNDREIDLAPTKGWRYNIFVKK